MFVGKPMKGMADAIIYSEGKREGAIRGSVPMSAVTYLLRARASTRYPLKVGKGKIFVIGRPTLLVPGEQFEPVELSAQQLGTLNQAIGKALAKRPPISKEWLAGFKGEIVEVVEQTELQASQTSVTQRPSDSSKEAVTAWVRKSPTTANQPRNFLSRQPVVSTTTASLLPTQHTSDDSNASGQAKHEEDKDSAKQQDLSSSSSSASTLDLSKVMEQQETTTPAKKGHAKKILFATFLLTATATAAWFGRETLRSWLPRSA